MAIDTVFISNVIAFLLGMYVEYYITIFLMLILHIIIYRFCSFCLAYSRGAIRVGLCLGIVLYT